ncbi:MAG: thioredoxin-dependent thiol peroxidase [Verrucomicrobia bacterium]|nr:thioredoxin-dependent thiol peroxidase [Verrucomicrobiota bacterium]|tara:strand:+ start:392 stop:844 length:453 start_codon:yes stop_codon:yes gene_type:complete
MSKLNIGDKAPDIYSTDQDANSFDLSTFKGKKVVLFFYPKDDTPGCTKEACNLRDNYARFQSEGYEIVGVSADSTEKHQKFITKYDLPFTLLADVDKKIINDYGAWGLKKFMGKEYEGIIRMTYVIDEDGNIEDIIDKVKTKEHTSQILK